MYQTSKSNVSEHIKHIIEEGELLEESVVREFRTTATISDVEHDYLDAIKHLGKKR